MQTAKRKYYNLAMSLPRDWLEAQLRDPSPYQGPVQIAITRLALRDMKERGK